MIIISDDEKTMLMMEHLVQLNIHKGNKRTILATFAGYHDAPIIIAQYDTPKKADRAMGMLATAVCDGVSCFQFPTNEAPELNTVITDSKPSRGYKMTGKTK